MATLPQQHKEVETGGQEEILQEIVRISELDTNNPDVVILSGLKLHNLATQAASDNLGDYLVQSLGLERIKRLQDFSLFFEITLDNAFMEGVLSGKFSDPDQHPLQPVYNLLAKREYDLVMNHAQNISRKPWIHIGSGYPETAIGIYKQFGIPIICVDKNKRVVQKAEPVLKKFNLWGEK